MKEWDIGDTDLLLGLASLQSFSLFKQMARLRGARVLALRGFRGLVASGTSTFHYGRWLVAMKGQV